MTAHILIPVRAFNAGKSRLSAILSASERAALNQRLFRHVLGIATAVVPPDRVLVVSRAPTVLDAARAAGAVPVIETGHGLNAALTEGAGAADSAAPLLTLSTDLPLLGLDDVRAMLATDADVVIAPDTAGTGTNALLLRRPGLIPYRYGTDSCARHRAAAAAAGLSIAVVSRPGLAEDVDTAEDLRRLGQFA